MLYSTLSSSCDRVDYSPVLFRKSALQEVGGLDEGLADPGMCGIWVS